MSGPRYALITAARNEERFIGDTIRSVLDQTVLPIRWVIVSDGSTDHTDEIVRGYASRYPFLVLVRMDATERRSGPPGYRGPPTGRYRSPPTGRSFASQADGLNRAAAKVRPCAPDFVGCLDADITLVRDHYEKLLSTFEQEPRLGIAGGWIHEIAKDGFRPRPLNSTRSVAGANQMFRAECFDRMGSFTPTPHGGLDTIAEVVARRNGYLVRSLPDLPVYHHRVTGGADGRLAGAFKAGVMDHEVGYRPLYELLVCARRLKVPVPALGSLSRLAGFLYAGISGCPRVVSEEIMDELRAEQGARMRLLVTALLRGRLDRSSV